MCAFADRGGAGQACVCVHVLTCSGLAHCRVRSDLRYGLRFCQTSKASTALGGVGDPSTSSRGACLSKFISFPPQSLNVPGPQGQS